MTQASSQATPMAPRGHRRRLLARSWAELRQNRLALIGLGIILVFGVMAIIHPLLRATVWQEAIYDPLTGHDLDLLHPSSPTASHLLGTDPLGRDVLSTLLAATRSTFTLAIIAGVTTALIAMLIGSIGAVYRRWPDAVLNHLSHALLLLPAPIFMLVIGAGELSQKIGPALFGLIYGVVLGLGAGAIVLRTQALQISVRPFIDAARVAGSGPIQIIHRHLLPHLIPLAGVVMMISVVGAVVAHGFASWFGQTSTQLDWGSLVYSAITFRHPVDGSIAWNALLPPAFALSVFAAAFYLISIGLRQLVDARERKSRN